MNKKVVKRYEIKYEMIKRACDIMDKLTFTHESKGVHTLSLDKSFRAVCTKPYSSSQKRLRVALFSLRDGKEDEYDRKDEIPPHLE